MRRLLGVLCVISAIWVVACAAERAAVDQGFVHGNKEVLYKNS